MDNILKKYINGLPPIAEILSVPLNFKGDFPALCGLFAHEPGTVALVSGGAQDHAKYHILGIDPWLVFRSKARKVTLTQGPIVTESLADPLQVLQLILDRFHLAVDRLHREYPIVSGLLGYLAYDLKDQIEALPRKAIDDLSLPDIYLVLPSKIIVHDKEKSESVIHAIRFEETAEAEILQQVKEIQKMAETPAHEFTNVATLANLNSNFSKEAYIRAVEKIGAYIKAGDVYQVNLAQRFTADFEGSPYSFFADLLEKNPASFFSFINAGGHQVISSSPERFILMADGQVETRPIKGTRPRGKDQKEDIHLKNQLASSAKDEAELSMIVDLMRNDLGKVCQAGTVKVTEHKKIEAYTNVFHLVSIIEGKLEKDRNATDLLKATFPGGSITGCPKIRAMEIIDELEPNKRHVYTGSIGYISFHQTMDLNIAIRTATVIKDKIFFPMGGGIVYDSDPAEEYLETLAKGGTIMSIIGGK